MPTSRESDPASSHWEAVYAARHATAVSWYREKLDASLALLRDAGVLAASRVIDVGGGASTLVDHLLDAGVEQVTVLDLSSRALAVAQARLGARAASVRWICGDITRVALDAGAYTHWHDRAAMHFLVEPADLGAYAAQAARAVEPGGYAVIGGFAPDGPARCSGLPVARRCAQEIAAILGPAFELIECRRELHQTPDGRPQAFEFARLRRC